MVPPFYAGCPQGQAEGCAKRTYGVTSTRLPTSRDTGSGVLPFAHGGTGGSMAINLSNLLGKYTARAEPHATGLIEIAPLSDKEVNKGQDLTAEPPR